MTIKDAEYFARGLIIKHLGTVCCNPLYEVYEELVGERAESVMLNEIKKLAAKFKVAPENIFFGYTDGANNFEIVKKIPRGFFVWNIGECMNSNIFIPLCEKKIGGSPYEIEQTTLKAIKLPPNEVELIRKAAGWGIKDLKTARKCIGIKLAAAENENVMSDLAEKVLPIYERITEE